MVETAILQKMVNTALSDGYEACYWQATTRGLDFMLRRRHDAPDEEGKVGHIRVSLVIDESSDAIELRSYMQRRMDNAMVVLDKSLEKYHANKVM